MTTKDAEYLTELARQLQSAPRSGEPIDDPEGVRVVKISSTLADEIAERLYKIARRA